MYKTFTKSLFLLCVFFAFAFKPAFAQTITIGGNFVPGTYTPGSSIGVPFETSGACINTGNTFNLYLANASGTILSGTPIGTFTGIYGTYVNGTIPASTAPGTYTVVIKSTSPVATSAPSPTFTVANGATVIASVTGQPITNNNPNIFGNCTGQAGAQYFFTNNSGTSSATANFYNESTQANEGSPVTLAQTNSFTAQATNYTIMVQTTNGISIATQAYFLINNVVNNSFGSSNNNTVCLSGSGGTLTYFLDISSANGLQKNFPGNTYQVSWGDGSTTTYDICQLMSSGGQISHTYTTGSCGNAPNGQANAFEVDVQPQSPYCGTVGTRITSYARVIRSPTNSFNGPTTACTNSAVTFTNTSDPGQDVNATANSCLNPNALYTWSVDGTVVLANAHQSQTFTYTFTTNGNHTVTLALQNGSAGPCTATPVTQTICIQNAPQPAFALPATACLSNPVAATDQSVVDHFCNTNPYLWTVTGPGTVSYAGGTSNTSQQPQFVFPTVGTYTVKLTISSGSCTAVSATHTINIDGPPTVSMSPNAAVCGTNLTYTFGPGGGITQTTITGTAVATASTYTWTVTGDPGYSFVNGTTANSQYPQIKFTDYAAYTISVVEQNSCGTSPATSQTITFQNAPTVTITPSVSSICPGSPVTLTANITGSYNSLQWTSSGAGTFSAGTSTTTNYTPSQAEINAGAANITVTVRTSLSGACANVTKNITINIYPVDNITSALTKQICTGSPVNYNITSSVAGSTYTWTAALTSGTATGFNNGSGSSINDVLTNNGPGDAVVTYTITAMDAHGCTGPPSALKVTVKPLSTVTATPANSPICSGSPAGIGLTPSINGATYTWTSSATGGITGNSQQSTPTATNVINDVLSNSGNTAGSVTYVITPYNATCPGPPTTATVNVQPLPVPANAGPNDEQCSITSYTLNGNTPPSGTGQWSVVSGPSGAVFANTNQPNTIVNGLVPGNIYQFKWTITIPGCQSSSNTMTLKDDATSVGGTTSGTATVCAGSNNGTITLSGQMGNVLRWESSTDGGTTWTSIANTTASLQYTNLNTTTQYRAFVQSGLCPGVYSSLTTITVNAPAVQANAGPNTEVCNTPTYTLQGNTPGAGSTGLWTVTSGPSGATFTDATQPNTTVNGLVPGTYHFTWTITPQAPCAPSSNTVQIIVDPASVGGTTSGAATVCSGGNSGTITLTGQVGTIITWQSSTDGGSSFNPVANSTGTTLQYSNLTTTTQYRVQVQSGVCTPAFSTVTTITVNAPAVQANAGPNNEVCNTPSYTLQGNAPGAGSTGHWTVTSGPAGATFTDSTQPNTTVNGLVAGTYQFTWTISPQAPCAPNSSTVTIIVDPTSVGGTTTGATTVCSGNNSGTINLTGQVGTIITWQSSTDGGTTFNPVANSTGTSLQYSNLTTTTQYRVQVQSGVCSPAFSSVTTITVSAPAVQANAGPNNEVCNTSTYTLQGNAPGVGSTGMWTVTSGPAGATFADATQPNTNVNGLVPGTYQFTWTITPQAPCAPSSSTVTLVIDSATIGGTTSASTTVCSGNNAGTITLAGQVGKIITWQSSTDGGNTFTPVANNTGATLQYSNLTTTTEYRVQVQSGVCSVAYSSVTTITVNPPTLQANAGGDQNLCGATTATLQGNASAPFTGTWTQTAGPTATIVSANSNQTQVTGLIPGNDYTFVWTIQGLSPCPNSSDAAQIHDALDVTPSFTASPTTGCGTYTVNFTNTSTSLTGTTFSWDFGDGSAPSSAVNPSHAFAPRNDGKDTTYTVSLSIVNNCLQRPPYTTTITVRPQNPVATIFPEQLSGCSPFVIKVDNTSPGNNTSYVFYLYNGSTLVQQITKTDKSTAVFDPVTTSGSTTTFTVYMVATGYCNNTTESNHIPIQVSPPSVTAQMFIEGGVNKGCAPLSVVFINNSNGGDNYFYTIYDNNNNVVAHLVASKANYPYTFTTPATFFVTITGSDNCSTSESPKTRVDIYPTPKPQFIADVTTACKQVTVNFANLTPDDPSAPATSLTYLWDFGDNTQSTAFTPPPHTYGEKGSPYTVSLTATNPATGCSSTVTKSGYIVVTTPPAPDFKERPDSVTTIPNYTFAFSDQSTGSPTTWIWSFGDGSSSTSRNPSHTYPDTGIYKVTLTVASASGCDSTISHNVRITGTPGQLFLPNAFEPDGSDIELRTFMAKGSGIKEWHMQIFNNYSQLVWETTKLGTKGEPIDGWDGTFKGAPAPQGVYIWQVSATFINGTEWKGNSYNNSLPKRVGVIHLIR